jgi:hypothetical protein
LLGGSVDPLFESRAADNLFAVAEAGLSSRLPMLVPEIGDPGIKLTQLGGEDDVMSTGQTMQESGTLLACALDLATNITQ